MYYLLFFLMTFFSIYGAINFLNVVYDAFLKRMLVNFKRKRERSPNEPD